jgi:hypothetical protein
MDARIDEMLAPLIKRLWQNGILTCNSCQENRPGIAWIQFASPFDAMNFLNVVATLPSKKDFKNYRFRGIMYDRMTCEGQFGEWEYKCHVRNEREHEGQADFNFAISVRFPLTDLPAIMRAFEDDKRVQERVMV